MRYNKNSGYGLLQAANVESLGSGKYRIVGDSGTANRDMLTELFGEDVDGQARFYATTDAAISDSTASAGDKILVMPGHTESLTTAAAIAADVAGIEIIGLGVGGNRPTYTFSSTDNAATWTISADNVKLKNVILICNDDGLTNALVVTGNNCEIDIEFRDTSSAVEAATAVRLDTADNVTLNLVYKGFTGGNAVVSAVRIDDCDNVRINIDGFGVVSTAWVEMVDAASTNVVVTGSLYTQGVTNMTRLVVNTVGSSTWFAKIDDRSAGSIVLGSNVTAFADADISAISADVTTILGLVGGTDSGTNILGANDADNGFDSSSVAANDDGSLVERLEGLKQGTILARGTFTTSSATVPADTGRAEANDYWNGCLLVPVAGAIAFEPRLIVDFANAGGVFTLDVDIPFTAVPGLVSYVIIPGNIQLAPLADSTANATPAHVVGNKTDAAATGAVSATESLMAYVKQLVTEGIARDTAITTIDDFLDSEIGTADGATTESINGKLGTDTELADRSLYDQINGAGPASAATAAAPANDVSLYGAVRYLSEQQMTRLASKNYANLTGYDTAAAFTVTGDVMVRVFGVVGAVAITSTSGTTTLAVGTTEDTDAILPATTIDNGDFDATDVWVDNNPEDDAGAVAATTWVIVGGGADIILTRSVDDITAGGLTLYCEWKPLSADGSVVAA